MDGDAAPTQKHEYLLYQTLVGAWPIGWNGKEGRPAFEKRIAGFLEKAGKEAKEVTSWTNPDSRYDAAVLSFLRGAFGSDALMDGIRSFAELITPYGAANSCAQTLLRLCAPGVPDTYQGAELWNQSLVDPDNRRPVEYGRRRDLLATIRGRKNEPLALAKDLLATFEDGRMKLYVTHVALLARRDHRDLFLRGDYQSLPAGEHVVAFTRGFDSQRFICCVPRLSYLRTRGERPFAIGPAWGNDHFAVPFPGRYRNLYTGAVLNIGGDVNVCDVLADFPVALLIREGDYS